MASTINASLTAGLVTTADTTGNLNLQSGGATVVAVTSAGQAVTGTGKVSTGFAVGGATAGAGGVAFPATAVAVADANTLDDYEESTWTPTLAFGGASVGITYTANYNTASVTKIGSRVFVSGITILTSKGSSTGNASLTSLPFPADGIKAFSAVTCSLTGVTFTGQYSMELDANADVVYFYQVSNLGVQSNLTDTNFANGSAFVFSFSYYTT